MRTFKSKNFMSDETKKENEIINYSVSQKETTICHRNEKKRHHMVTRSCVRARNGDGGEGGRYYLFHLSCKERFGIKFKQDST